MTANGRQSVRVAWTWALLLAATSAKGAGEQALPVSSEPPTPRSDLRAGDAPPPPPAAPASLGLRLLWYVPNRLVDLADILRLRLRLGPGLAVGARMTDYGAFYGGCYHAVYVGLPGPRHQRLVRWPVGWESLDGIVLGGVDATDDTPHGPEYAPTEVDIGAHLLVVGADVGVDPLEIGDFLAGLLLVDIRADDYPRPRQPAPRMTSGLVSREGDGMFEVAPKPAYFDGLPHRLEYLHTNVQLRISRPVRTVDEYLAADTQARIPVPESRLRLGIYTEFVQGHERETSFSPDVDLDVALPNVERRLHIFVQSGQADDLPGLTPSETSTEGLTLGARRAMERYAVSGDVGLRASWPPRAYGRLAWQPDWVLGRWSWRPQQRLFVDTRDKWGSLTTLTVDRWFGEEYAFHVGSVSSAKYTQDSGLFTWEQTLRVGHVREAIEDRASVGRYERRDVADGGDVSFSILGIDSDISVYRLKVGLRRPLYQRWIFWEVEPGIEWTAANDFDPALRITLGIDMLFWGPVVP